MSHCYYSYGGVRDQVRGSGWPKRSFRRITLGGIAWVLRSASSAGLKQKQDCVTLGYLRAGPFSSRKGHISESIEATYFLFLLRTRDNPVAVTDLLCRFKSRDM
jgi:hypothetical protein